MASTGNDQTSITLYLEQTAAGTDRKIFRQFRQTGDWKILNIDFMPDDSAAVGATNFTTVSLENETSGTVLHTFDNNTGGTAFVLGTVIPLATLPTGTDFVISDGDVLSFDKTDSGSGEIMGGSWTVTLQQLRG